MTLALRDALRFAASLGALATLALGAAAAQTGPSTESVRGVGSHRPGRVPEAFAPDLVAALRITRTPVFSPDGAEMYWTAGVGPWRSVLVRARLVEDAWRGPDTLAFSTGEFFDHNPALSPDGRRLVFASNRPIPGKEATTIPGTPVPTSDLFVAERSGGGWSAPRPLGPAINTTFDDDVPVLTRDGALYFSSSRPGGPGPGRIYRARPEAELWAPPEPLPAPVTTGAGEMVNHVGPDDDYVIYYSMARGDSGGLHIAFRAPDGSWAAPAPLSGTVRALRAYFATVTPDGRWLLFTGSAGGGGPRVYWVDAGVLRESTAAPATPH